MGDEGGSGIVELEEEGEMRRDAFSSLEDKSTPKSQMCWQFSIEYRCSIIYECEAYYLVYKEDIFNIRPADEFRSFETHQSSAKHKEIFFEHSTQIQDISVYSI